MRQLRKIVFFHATRKHFLFDWLLSGATKVSAFDLIFAGIFLIVFQKAPEKTQLVILALFGVGIAISGIVRFLK
jgi:uncharacterized membrane protein HdeD (DUF308 family)